MPDNSNCLEGIRCPRCGQNDAFDIGATVTLRVTDAGWTAEESQDAEWDEKSRITCPDCNTTGTIRDFSH